MSIFLRNFRGRTYGSYLSVCGRTQHLSLDSQKDKHQSHAKRKPAVSSTEMMQCLVGRYSRLFLKHFHRNAYSSSPENQTLRKLKIYKSTNTSRYLYLKAQLKPKLRKTNEKTFMIRCINRSPYQCFSYFNTHKNKVQIVKTQIPRPHLQRLCFIGARVELENL